MRLRRAKIRGFGPFSDVSVDFDELPEGAQLVALCGENGEGKSTLVDLMVDGAMYRDWPRRSNTIAHVATGRDSLLEVETDIGGKTYLLRHLVDGVSGKGESAAFLDGEPLTKSGKLTEFYAWGRENLPPKSVIHSSIVSHPAYGSFVAMKASERKDVVLLAIGLEGIEKTAASAREKAKASAVTCDELRRRLAEVATSGDVETTEQKLQEARLDAEEAQYAEDAASGKLFEARNLTIRFVSDCEWYREQKAARETIEERHFAFTCDLVAVRGQLDWINVEAASTRKTSAELAVSDSTAKLEAARQSAIELQQQAERIRQTEERREELSAEFAREQKSAEEIATRLRNNQTVLARADEIRAAIREREEAPIGELDLEALNWSKQADAVRSEVASLRREAQWIVGQLADLEARRDSLRKALAREPEILLAVEELPSARAEVGHRQANINAIEAEIAGLRSERLASADERIGFLRSQLEVISDECDPDEAASIAEKALSDDDDKVERTRTMPSCIGLAESERDHYRIELEQAEARVRRLEASATLAGRLDEDNRAHDEAERKIAALEARDVEITAAIGALIVAAHDYAAKSTTASSRARELRDRLESLVPLLKLEKPLETAEARIAELSPVIEAAKARCDSITRSLEALPPPQAAPAIPDLRVLQAAVDAAQSELQSATAALAKTEADQVHLTAEVERLREEVRGLHEQLEALPPLVQPDAPPDVKSLETALRTAQERAAEATRAVGAAESRLEAAKAARAKATTLREELATQERELADWTRLGSDLGRKGLQAALVDSAGPELTRSTNDLLHECFGTRWTVSYETQRTKADGDSAEGYDIRIIDTEKGFEGVVEDLSDGERTIISSAASLALAELACKRAGFEHPTIILDESGAALSAERRPMWVAMIRRAAKHVNASRVLLVSHSEDVQSLCDVRMRVAGGKVEVLNG